MIKFVDGDFFDFDADIRINTVNCVGVMGAGVALLFKSKYPKMFQTYKKQCQQKEIKPGAPSVWREGDMFSKGITIINFPTKDHWKSPSKYEYVELGLVWLRDYLKNIEPITITIPALGCGHGGLEWDKVKNIISQYLGDLDHNILVFNPQASKLAGKQDPDKNILYELKQKGVELYDTDSSLYPQSLRRYTEKKLYVYGNHDLNFDIAMICSSRPSDTEKTLVANFMDCCLKSSLSILIGSSSFEKKLAAKYAINGLKVGHFLPSGIIESANKLSKKNELKEKLSLLSIGNPFETFDKKEYLPSVLSRMFMAKVVVFTTPRLSWLDKHKNFLNEKKIRSLFVEYLDLKEEDKMAAASIQAEPVNPLSLDQLYSHIKALTWRFKGTYVTSGPSQA